MNLDVETVSFGIISLVLIASGLASSLMKRTFHSVMFLGVFLVAVAALYILLGSPLVGVIQILVYVGGILTLFVFAVMFVAGDETETVEKAPAHKPRSNAWSILAGIGILGAVLYLATTFVADANHAAGGLFGGHYDDSGKAPVWVADNLAMAVGFVAGVLFIVVLAVAGLLGWLGARHAIDQWSGTRIFGTALAAMLAGLLVGIVLDPADMVPGPPAWSDAVATEASVAAANDLSTVVDAMFDAQVVPLEILGVLLTAVMVGALVLARPLQAPADSDRYPTVSRAQVREAQQVSDVALHTGPAPPASMAQPSALAMSGKASVPASPEVAE